MSIVKFFDEFNHRFKSQGLKTGIVSDNHSHGYLIGFHHHVGICGNLTKIKVQSRKIEEILYNVQ